MRESRDGKDLDLKLTRGKFMGLSLTELESSNCLGERMFRKERPSGPFPYCVHRTEIANLIQKNTHKTLSTKLKMHSYYGTYL